MAGKRTDIRDFTVGEIEDAKAYFPQKLVDMAYDLYDTITKHACGDFNVKFHVTGVLPVKGTYESLHPKYTIYCGASSHATYHNDSQTVNELRLKTGERDWRLNLYDRETASTCPKIIDEKEIWLMAGKEDK